MPIFVFEAGIDSFFVLTLLTNLTATSLIAGKTWTAKRRMSGLITSHTKSPILVIVIESEAVYSISLIALPATFLKPNWGQYVAVKGSATITVNVTQDLPAYEDVAKERQASNDVESTISTYGKRPLR